MGSRISRRKTQFNPAEELLQEVLNGVGSALSSGDDGEESVTDGAGENLGFGYSVGAG